MTPTDYLAIFCVAVPLAAVAIFAVVIVMKQEWIKLKGG